jgi:DNA invertase Pin-like site-specific DNA recombinase
MNCFIYARKSTESEEKQVLSIDAQIKELKAVALKQGLNVLNVFQESKSAKAPGRPIFNKLIEELYKAKDTGILCWKLDRLARNPVDGGQLIWSVEQGKIREIVTPSRTHYNTGDDKFWMQLEFGIAKKYVDDLSDNVKRGIRAKLEKGVFPGKAPLGYLNDRETRGIKKDPDRFHLVRKLWEVILSGDYSVRELLRAMDEDWGLRTPQLKSTGGKPLTRSGLYLLLSNPFYYGMMKMKGELYPGSHVPMITKEQFEKVQRILGRPNTCPKTRQFVFTGMIRCGECGSAITAEETINRYGKRYTYYHCTKRKGGNNNTCGQKYIRAEDIETQTLNFLDKISLPEEYSEWAFKRLEQAQESELVAQAKMKRSVVKAHDECKRKIDTLLHLRLKGLLSDEEFVEQKNGLTENMMKYKARISQIERNPHIWLEPSERLIKFLTLAKEFFAEGDAQQKKEILETVSSNLLLKDKKLLITAKKPFRLVAENCDSPLWCTLVDKVRTFFSDPSRHFHIPVFKR